MTSQILSSLHNIHYKSRVDFPICQVLVGRRQRPDGRVQPLYADSLEKQAAFRPRRLDAGGGQ
jgi:hypothetical protein